MITIERIDPVTDERWIEMKRLAPVAGFDLVFSPPKGASLLHALGDADMRRVVNEAHLSAWQSAFDHAGGHVVWADTAQAPSRAYKGRLRH
jgi:TrwC relaxase